MPIRGSKTKQKSRFNVESDLYFDGINQHLVVPKTAELDFKNTDTFSIDLFTKFEKAGQNHFAGQRIGASGNFSWILIVDSIGRLHFDPLGVTSPITYSGFANEFLNKKVHIIAEFEPDGAGNVTKRLYVNSRLVAEGTSTVTADFTGLGNLIIGAGDSSFTLPHQGTISNFVIYKGRALTQGEVNQRYRNAGSVPDTLSEYVILHLPLSDRTATVADERIVYNNDYLTIGDNIFLDSVEQYNYNRELFYDEDPPDLTTASWNKLPDGRHIIVGENNNIIEITSTTGTDTNHSFNVNISNSPPNSLLRVEYDIDDTTNPSTNMELRIHQGDTNNQLDIINLQSGNNKGVWYAHPGDITNLTFRITVSLPYSVGEQVCTVNYLNISTLLDAKHAKTFNFTDSELGITTQSDQTSKIDFYNKRIDEPYGLTFNINQGGQWIFQEPLSTTITLPNSGFTILGEIDFEAGGGRMLDTFPGPGNTYIRIEPNAGNNSIEFSAANSTDVSNIEVSTFETKLQFVWEYTGGDPTNWVIYINGAKSEFTILNSSLIGNEPTQWDFTSLYLGKRQNSGINLFQGIIRRMLFIDTFINRNEFNTIKDSDSRVIESINFQQQNADLNTKLGNSLAKVNYNDPKFDYFDFKNNYRVFNKGLKFNGSTYLTVSNFNPTNEKGYTYVYIGFTDELPPFQSNAQVIFLKRDSNRLFLDYRASVGDGNDISTHTEFSYGSGLRTIDIPNGFSPNKFNMISFFEKVKTINSTTGYTRKYFLNGGNLLSKIENDSFSLNDSIDPDWSEISGDLNIGRDTIDSNYLKGGIAYLGIIKGELNAKDLSKIWNNSFVDILNLNWELLLDFGDYYSDSTDIRIKNYGNSDDAKALGFDGLDVNEKLSDYITNLFETRDFRLNAKNYLTQFGVYKDEQIFFENSPWID